MAKTTVIELRKIKKHFGPVKANDGVDLLIRTGEIHAILGENGSGKSTLMNILSGLYLPDSGEILADGAPITIRSPKDAMERGIGMIHQHFKLVEALSAWENIVGGMRVGLFLSKKKIIAKISALCGKFKLQLDPEKKVYHMTIGEKQTLEIVKALYRGAEIMILDEPTAVLTTQEADKLFDILREMKANGCAVIIITHKLHEVMDVSDRVTVLRKGVSVASVLTRNTTPEQLAGLMVGRDIDITLPYVSVPREKKEAVLSIRGLRMEEKGAGRKLNIRILDVNAYEILGVAGVADSGQSELCNAIAGLQKASGSISLNGKELLGMTPRAMRRQGVQLGFVPEDRLGTGLAEGLSVSDNVSLRSYHTQKGLFLDKKAELRRADQLISDYHVSTAGATQAIQNLSGGNIQKVLLGREIDRKVNFIIAAYPVRGLDIGASDFIFGKLNEEKQKGAAILFVGEDLDALLGVCDRIAVLHGGELMGVVNAKTATKSQLGLMMMGLKREDATDAAN
jgi:general nucleoside transport system ATP-binding protein